MLATESDNSKTQSSHSSPKMSHGILKQANNNNDDAVASSQSSTSPSSSVSRQAVEAHDTATQPEGEIVSTPTTPDKNLTKALLDHLTSSIEENVEDQCSSTKDLEREESKSSSSFISVVSVVQGCSVTTHLY